MAWKKRCIIMSVLCLLLSCSCRQVQAYSIYNEGAPSTTIVNYFNGILNDYPLQDYVIWRESQYIYHLAIGNMTYDNNVYIADSQIDLYTINSYNQYNNTYTIEKSRINNFTLSNTNNYLIYSNLGYMPNLQERGSFLEYSILFIMLLYLVYKLVWFVLRFGAS